MAVRRAIRAAAIPLILRAWRKSPPSCASPGTGVHGARMRALVVVLWRAGLRIHEALALAETDLEPRRGSILVRRGKGGKRREVGMDRWGKRRDQPAWRRR